jgi:hypothetical protein
MRTFVILVIILSLASGGVLALISALRQSTVNEPITILPGVTLTPQDLKDAGLAKASSVEYAGKTFVFFPDESANGEGKELATVKSGMTIDLQDGGAVTFLGGQFSQDGGTSVRDRAYAWYRSKVADTGLADDKEAAIVGDASARYDDTAAAALLVRKNDTVFTLIYTLGSAASTAPRPIVALEALARLIASRL